MDRQLDWLDQTWEIKRNIAHRYAGVPFSEQLRDMEARLREKWAERGWTYPEPSLAGLPKRPDEDRRQMGSQL